MRKLIFGLILIGALFGVTFLLVKALDIYKGYDLYKSQYEILINKRYIQLREFEKGSHTKASDQYELLKGRTFHLNISEEGFQEGDRPNHENPDLKVAFLGGSTTACVYVDEKNRFPNVFRNHLEDSLGIKVNIFNNGVDGSNTMHSVNSFINKVLPKQPDYAIMMHNVNDLSVLMHANQYWNEHPTRALVIDSAIFKNLWTDRSDHIFPNLATVWDMVQNSGPRKEFHGASNIDFKAKIEKAKVLYKNALKTFVVSARAWGVKPILMTQVNERGEITDLVASHKDFNVIVREVANEYNVPLVDLEAHFGTRNVFYDNMHFHDEGSIEAAAVMWQQLKGVFQE